MDARFSILTGPRLLRLGKKDGLPGVLGAELRNRLDARSSDQGLSLIFISCRINPKNSKATF